MLALHPEEFSMSEISKLRVMALLWTQLRSITQFRRVQRPAVDRYSCQRANIFPAPLNSKAVLPFIWMLGRGSWEQLIFQNTANQLSLSICQNRGGENGTGH